MFRPQPDVAVKLQPKMYFYELLMALYFFKKKEFKFTLLKKN